MLLRMADSKVVSEVYCVEAGSVELVGEEVEEGEEREEVAAAAV